MSRLMGWAAVAAWMIWGTATGLAESEDARREALVILEEQVRLNEERVLHAQRQYEAGRVGTDEMRDAELALQEARLRLIREGERPVQDAPGSLLHQPVPELNLPEAPLGEVCDILRDRLGGKANFVLEPGAGHLLVPALQLKGVDLLTLLNVLTESVPALTAKVALGSQVVHVGDIMGDSVRVSSTGTRRMTGSPQVLMPGAAGGVQMMSIESLTEGSRAEAVTVIFEGEDLAPQSFRETRTIYLGGLLQSMDFDDVLTSIQTAWSSSHPSGVDGLGTGGPTLKFHEDTELLIAAGDPRYLGIVDEVIEQLADMQKDLIQRSNTSMKEEYKKAREELFARVTEERAQMEKKLAEAQEETKSIRNEVSAHYREQMEDELRAAREEAFAERRGLLERIDELERRLGKTP